MSRDRLFLFPLIVVLFFLGACQSEGKLIGEIFVTTEGGRNVELGDLEVRAITVSRLENHLEQKQQEAKEVTKTAARQARDLLDSLETLDSQVEQAKREFTDARRQRKSEDEFIRNFETVIAERMPPVDQIDRFYATPKSRLRSNPFGASITDLELGEPLQPIEKEEDHYRVRYSGNEGYVFAGYLITEEQYEAYQTFKEEQKNVTRLVKKRDNQYTEARARCKTIKDSLLTDTLIDYDRLLESERVHVLGLMSEDEVGAEDFRSPKFVEATLRFRSLDHYFQNFPEPKDTERTNSAGEFELTVTQETPYYLVAKGRRSVGDETEEYWWIVKTTLEEESSEVILSNSNADTELPDSLNVVADAPIDSKSLFNSIKYCN